MSARRRVQVMLCLFGRVFCLFKDPHSQVPKPPGFHNFPGGFPGACFTGRFGRCFFTRYFGPLLQPFGIPSGLYFSSKLIVFPIEKCIAFLTVFQTPFRSLLALLLLPFFSQNRYCHKKGASLKISVSCKRELDFPCFAHPKPTRKTSNKLFENQCTC